MIKNFFSDLAFSYYKQYGSSCPEYLGNWKDIFPANLYEKLDTFSWECQPERNYYEVDSRLDINDIQYQEYLTLTHFQAFKSIDNARWKIADYRSLVPDSNALLKKLDDFCKVYKVWVTQIPPGCCIPQHVDTVDAFIKDFDIQTNEVKDIKRFVILPSAIEPWHHLWYGRKIIAEGSCGDVWSFNFWEPHGGSNLGPDNKYTIQVMGI